MEERSKELGLGQAVWDLWPDLSGFLEVIDHIASFEWKKEAKNLE